MGRQRRSASRAWPSLAHSELGLGLLQRGQQHVSNVAGRLVQVKAHALGAKPLAHNVELNAAHISAPEKRTLGVTEADLFSLIMYAMP